MDIHIDNHVPDVYDQRRLIAIAAERAYREGMGTLHISVKEPQDSANWLFDVRGPEGQLFEVVITASDQVDYANLPDIMMFKLREVLTS